MPTNELTASPLLTREWNFCLPAEAQAAPIWRKENTFRELVASYREVQRAYHGIIHIEDCLSELNACERQEIFPHDWFQEARLALIYHDVVYDPERKDNEAQSLCYLNVHLKRLGAERSARRAPEMIIATRHEGKALPDYCELVVDIDLASLGVREAQHFENTRKIRFEYAHIPGFTNDAWLSGRRKFLEGMLARRHIYYTSYFRERFEHQARENMLNELRTICAE